MKNNWEDFTRSNYRRLLKIATGLYRLRPVRDWQNPAATALWRHDVDFSPQSALALAKIEHDEGVQATYYFNLRSDFYNLIEPAVVTIAREISETGHEIGIHLDAAQVDVSSIHTLDDALRREQLVFESIIGVAPKSFSFHNPSDKTASYQDISYGGLINAYNAELLQRFAYCSDSNGYWRFTPLEAFLQQKHPSICVLTHPDWWQEKPMSPRDRVVRAVEGRAAATLRRYDELLEAKGRNNLRT